MSLQMMAEHSRTNKGGKIVPEDRTYRIDYGRLEQPTILIHSLIPKKKKCIGNTTIAYSMCILFISQEWPCLFF